MKFKLQIRNAVMMSSGLLGLALFCAPLHAEPADAAIIPSFSLASHRGVEWSLHDVPDNRLVVVTFLGTECPLAKLYGPRLVQLQQQYADKGVEFIGINSNTQDSITEITTWVANHDISFPMLKDVGNRVADQFQAERTPEVFVLDQQRRVRYRGRIDDQYLVGLARDQVQRHDLAIALDELLAGQTVSEPRTVALGCHIGRVKNTEPKGDITWSGHIAAIFNNRCLECHRQGEIAPFTLGSYEDVIGWEDTILEVIADNRMPPWYANPDHGTFANDARLTSEEKRLIRQWVGNGMPPGDLQEVPEPPQFVKGWRMPEPDQVIQVRNEPFQVPAQGIVDYQYFTVDPGWDEDKYISAAEARPDNVPVVHHIIAYVVPPEKEDKKRRNRRMLVGYAPGALPRILQPGHALHVPAGSQLLFEMHYTPNGTPQTDLSYIGLKFIDAKDVTTRVHGGAAMNTKFEIPAQEAGHVVTADHRTPKDVLLLDMTPHMHLRGKAFRYEVLFPNGKREVLLDVPNYDFNWQLTYHLQQPRLIPKGSRLLCTATYDNSKRNPANPDPNTAVRWGDQSSEEMMIGFFNYIDANR